MGAAMEFSGIITNQYHNRHNGRASFIRAHPSSMEPQRIIPVMYVPRFARVSITASTYRISCICRKLHKESQCYVIYLVP